MRIIAVIQSIMIILASLSASALLAAEQKDKRFGEIISESVVNPDQTVSDATFTTDLQDNQPTEYLSEIENTVKTVYFFCRINGLKGQSILHRWRREGQIVAEIDIRISAEHVAVWSKQDMRSDWTGEWTVEVVDSHGDVIATSALSYLAPL